MRQMLGRNSFASVFDRYLGVVFMPVEDYFDGSSGRRELDCVREQVGEHALNLYAIEIAGAVRDVAGELQFDVAAFGRNLELIHDAVDGFHQIHRLLLEDYLAGFGLREKQERADNCGKPFDIGKRIYDCIAVLVYRFGSE